MSLLDNIKNILVIPPEDDMEDDYEEQAAPKAEPRRKSEPAEQKRAEQTPRIIGGGRKGTNTNAPQMQVVLVKPERYDDVTSIADHLNDRKTVVLNLEVADKDMSRRIVDFLSGAAYAIGGNIRKVSKATFVIVPFGVDMMGELVLDEFDEGKMYF